MLSHLDGSTKHRDIPTVHGDTQQLLEGTMHAHYLRSILCFIFIFTCTAGCEDGIKMAQFAQRSLKAAKSLNDDGESKDPKLRALQTSAKQACDHIVHCAEERERESGEIEDDENLDDLKTLCESSKLIVMHAQVAGNKCVAALTKQFDCVAQTPCDEQDDESGVCKALMEQTEKVCSEFWDDKSSDD